MAFDNNSHVVTKIGNSLSQVLINNIRSNIALSIKKSLLKIAPGELEIVSAALKSEFDIYLFDSFDHPEYLKKTLIYYYKEKYLEIIDSIEEDLGDLTKNKLYSNFLKDMREHAVELST